MSKYHRLHCPITTVEELQTFLEANLNIDISIDDAGQACVTAHCIMVGMAENFHMNNPVMKMQTVPPDHNA